MTDAEDKIINYIEARNWVDNFTSSTRHDQIVMAEAVLSTARSSLRMHSALKKIVGHLNDHPESR